MLQLQMPKRSIQPKRKRDLSGQVPGGQLIKSRLHNLTDLPYVNVRRENSLLPTARCASSVIAALDKDVKHLPR
jgi:hypothetical protein